jgi:hypothetical protein
VLLSKNNFKKVKRKNKTIINCMGQRNMLLFHVLLFLLIAACFEAVAGEPGENIAPTVYVKPTAECLEGHTVDINTIRIDDVDAGLYLQPKMAVNISVSHGMLYFPLRNGLFFLQGSIVGPGNKFSVIGRLADVQRSFSNVKYVADVDYVGDADLEISVFDMHLQPLEDDGNNENNNNNNNNFNNDLGVDESKLKLQADHAPVTAHAVITVLPVNDAPVIAASQRYLTCDERSPSPSSSSAEEQEIALATAAADVGEAPLQLSAALAVTLRDADIQTDEQEQSALFRLSVSARYGSLTLEGIDVSQCLVTGSGDVDSIFSSSSASQLVSGTLAALNVAADAHRCVLQGTLSELNRAVSLVVYTPDVGYNKYMGSERIGWCYFFFIHFFLFINVR